MGKGGARARSGPTAQLDAARRERDKGDWVYLPTESEMDPPEWPLNRTCAVTYGRGEDAETEELHDREMALWRKLWAKGQALMWHIDGLDLEVALYCRALTKTEAQMDVTSSGMLAELRRMSEGLGLNAAGLLRNKWRFKTQDDHSVEAHELAEDANAAVAGNAAVVDLFAGVRREA
jgi:hypothetical protein